MSGVDDLCGCPVKGLVTGHRPVIELRPGEWARSHDLSTRTLHKVTGHVRLT